MLPLFDLVLIFEIVLVYLSFMFLAYLLYEFNPEEFGTILMVFYRVSKNT